MNRQLIVNQVMLKCANQPFEYGNLDCCLFAARVAQEIEGVDYGALFDHANEAEAYQYIDEAGGLQQLITNTLGRDPVDVDELDHGDPCLVRFPGVGDMLAVYSTIGAICKTKHATVTVPLERIKTGWNLCHKQ